MDASPDVARLRRQLRRDLGEDAFQRQPWRLLIALPAAAAIVLSTAVLVRGDPSWPVVVGLVLVAGNGYAVLGFLAHEVLHGSVVGPGRLRYAIGVVGFAPFLVSPELWQVWHNKVHHGNTNVGNRDPDGFGTVQRWERAPSTRFVTRLAPGSGTAASWAFLFYWFTFHGQVVLWVQSRLHPGFAGMDRRRAVRDTLLSAAGWVGFASWAGVAGSLLGAVAPMAVANFVVMSYIATNHFLRPQADGFDPVTTSMSVRTWRWVDVAHLHFSHHVEHHLFPAMSPRFAPRLRECLVHRVGRAYVAPPHHLAISWLYRTPRVYLDADTLVDIDTGRRVDIHDVTRILTAVD